MSFVLFLYRGIVPGFDVPTTFIYPRLICAIKQSMFDQTFFSRASTLLDVIDGTYRYYPV